MLRGVAVLVMIEAHVIDSWTRAADRANPVFGYSLILGGFGAPLFLFLAGVAIPMSAASKSRRLGSDQAGAHAVVRRGLEIFLLAFLFRLQAFVLGWSSPWTLLRVDILNVMGPTIMATAWLWGRFRTSRARAFAFAAACGAIAFATPAVR
ncbi:MAG TPA: heparan-alpha-glucosaminide N-acetyltransferase domain-containing protein, partial [Vicinamibacterales bacterium]|nr:heparan-alpha-glucosaminide N-acetyltransferase domain-containing protein [Vicinamibacterales bacterium]